MFRRVILGKLTQPFGTLLVDRKWNKCLYRELLKAYKEGRADRDPSELWYKGEIGFYNFYSKFHRFCV